MGNERRQRARKEGLGQRMKRNAKARRCEKCNRKSAVTRHQLDPWTVVRVCRWCGELPAQ